MRPINIYQPERSVSCNLRTTAPKLAIVTTRYQTMKITESSVTTISIDEDANKPVITPIKIAITMLIPHAPSKKIMYSFLLNLPDHLVSAVLIRSIMYILIPPF